MTPYEEVRAQFLTAARTQLDSGAVSTAIHILDSIMTKYDVTPSETSLVEYSFNTPLIVEYYFACKDLKGNSPLSVKNQKYQIMDMLKKVGKPVAEISPNDVRMYLAACKQNGKQDSTLAQYRGYINAFFQWALENGYVNENPVALVEKIKPEQKQRHALTKQQLAKVRAMCETTARDKCIIETMYSTGCRVSELVGLKISDIDLDNRTVHLFGKGRKHRTAFINDRCAEAIREYLASRNDNCEYLIISERAPVPVDTRSIERKYVKYSKKCGFDFTPHVMRHTMATNGLDNGMSVLSLKQTLGHRSYDTTLVYAEANLTKVKAEHAAAIV